MAAPATTMIAPVTAPFYFAIGDFSGTWPDGAALLSFDAPTNSATLWARSTLGNMGGVALMGINNGGLTLEYLTCGQPTGAGSEQAVFNVPLIVDADATVTGDLDVSGAMATTANSYEGAGAPPVNGCLITWNISGGYGESDFVNAGGSTGAFRWYNGPGGAEYDENSIPLMELVSNGGLFVFGPIGTRDNSSAGATATVNGCLIAWNLSDGLGETDFVNAGGTTGAFRWYNGAGSAAYDSNSIPIMQLDDAGNLTIGGDFTTDGDLTVENLAVNGDAVIGGNLSAERADFTGCFVNGSEVLTAADLPPGGIPYPPAGIGVSTGSAWEEDSIDATNPVFAGTVTANLKVKAFGFLPFDLTKTYVSIGTGNPASPPAIPDILLMNAAAPLDQKITVIGASVNSFYISATQDSGADHAWLWAHRSGQTITALDLILNSDGAAVVGGPNGLTIGWNFSAGVGETDFINNKSLGGGGFNWYNAAPGASLSAPLMTLDSNGNLTTDGSVTTPIVTAPTNLILEADGGGVLLCWSHGTGTFFGNGSSSPATVGQVDLSGNAIFSGTVTAGTTLISTTLVVTGDVDFAGGHWHTDGGSTQLTISPQYFYVTTAAGGLMQVIGDFAVTGSKSFACPHPLIEGKDLFHSSLEGPENGVFYRGEAVTRHGRAEVMLPTYFEALTFDDERSVLLTQITESDDEPLAILAATRIIDGIFWIRSSEDVRVAWEVKAVRRIGVDRLEVVRAKREPSDAIHQENKGESKDAEASADLNRRTDRPRAAVGARAR